MWEAKYSKQKDSKKEIQTIIVPNYEYFYAIGSFNDWSDAMRRAIIIIKESFYSKCKKNIQIHIEYNEYSGYEELCIDCENVIILYKFRIDLYTQRFTFEFIDAIIEDLIERTTLPKPKPKLGQLRPLKCTECGGAIDSNTLTCQFCGMKFYMI